MKLLIMLFSPVFCFFLSRSTYSSLYPVLKHTEYGYRSVKMNTFLEELKI